MAKDKPLTPRFLASVPEDLRAAIPLSPSLCSPIRSSPPTFSPSRSLSLSHPVSHSILLASPSPSNAHPLHLSLSPPLSLTHSPSETQGGWPTAKTLRRDSSTPARPQKKRNRKKEKICKIPRVTFLRPAAA